MIREHLAPAHVLSGEAGGQHGFCVAGWCTVGWAVHVGGCVPALLCPMTPGPRGMVVGVRCAVGPGVGLRGPALVARAGSRRWAWGFWWDVRELALIGRRVVAGWRVFVGHWWCVLGCRVVVRFTAVLVLWLAGLYPLWWVAGLHGGLCFAASAVSVRCSVCCGVM